MSTEHETETVSVKGALPVSMVLGALWLITMTLAGWYATDLRAQVGTLVTQQQNVATGAAALSVRVQTLEDRDGRKVDAKEMAEVLRRLERLETKLDDLRERDRGTARK